MPALLWAHNPAEVIGKWSDIQETPEGLHVTGKLNLETQRGREARALMLDGSLSGLSIGFRTRSAERRSKGRVLTDVDLVEASLVSLPCAPNARVRSVKETPTMSLELNVLDTLDETANDLPPELLERISTIETKANGFDELAGRLDKIETRLARPSTRVETKEDQAELETKAFLNWCRKGNEGLTELERKTLSTITTSPGTGGWNLVPETFLRELMRNLVEFSPMRSVARVQQVSGNPVILPKRLNTMAAQWVAEELEHGVSEPAYGQQSVPIFEARVTVEVTNALLEDAAFDIGAELAIDFAEEFGRLESAAFVNGNGISEPQGFRIASSFVTSQGNLTADNIIDLYHSIPSVYAGRGTWVMPRSAMAAVRKLKTTGTGVYLWTESLQPGNPASLLGRPVVEFPDLTAGGSPSQAVVAFGDWARAYRIFDRVGLEVLRDPFSGAKRSVVMFHARRRVGGALVDSQAVRGLSAG
jgi:HK97 family phage major capsid protein/HK97 family phage prohead protease